MNICEEKGVLYHLITKEWNINTSGKNREVLGILKKYHIHSYNIHLKYL